MDSIPNSNKLNANISMTYISLDQSEIDTSQIKKEINEKEKGKEKTDVSLDLMICEISDIFKEIKKFRNNFILEDYEILSRKIRKIISKIRKMYFFQRDNDNKLIKNQKIIINDTNLNQQSSSNQSNLITNAQSNTGNNTNSNSNINQPVNNNVKDNKNYILNESVITDYQNNKNVNTNIYYIKDPNTLNKIYNLILEIVSFLLCYDDIFINYENKSAFFTAKLFLQFSSLHFFSKIGKKDFFLMLVNKICNIFCKYNELDENIKKILILDNKEIENLKQGFNYDVEIVQKLQKKLKEQIDKLDLNYKIEKVKKESIIKNEEDINIELKDDMNYKFNKLNKEKEILESIQNNLDDNYKMFLKEPLKNELKLFNELINKLTQYKTPLIKKKIIDIILRNHEVFNYINENILIDKIPKEYINRNNLYPFNKNLSVFIDKYIITGKIILEELTLPLVSNYLYVYENLEAFSKKFLGQLFKATNVKTDNKKEIIYDIKFELNYYHITLFSYMISSDIKKREYFNRISALITTNLDFDILCENIGNIEDILNTTLFNNNSMILFDYMNMQKNTISFLLEKKEKEKSKLELCNILSKILFKTDSLYILLTIALKYWAIKRKIFIYDNIKRKQVNPVLDDFTLLYFIYYFLIHKGKIECFKFDENKNKNKDKDADNLKEENDSEEDEKDKKEEKEDSKIKKEDKSKIIKDEEKNENQEIKCNKMDKEKVSSILQNLGELFIEFLWFIHELMDLILKENKKNEENYIYIKLTDKNYYSYNYIKKKKILKKEEKGEKKVGKKDINERIENSILIFGVDDEAIDELDKQSVEHFKKEATRALYYLLNSSGKELFAFKE